MFGLKRQYARTLGLIAGGEDRAEDLAHLAAVIRMFKPGEDLAAIQAVRPYRPNRSKWSREALGILREANAPMAPRELAHRVLGARGVARTRANLQRVECSLHAVLERLEGRGVVRAEGSPKRWSVER